MVRRADTNNNNMLEPDELQNGYGRPVRFMAERAGLNINQTLRVDEVVSAMERMRGGSSSSSPGSGYTTSSTPTTNSQAFGTQTQTQAAMVPGFGTAPGGASGATGVAATSNLPLEQRFDSRILERARERMRELDRNGNGTLEGEELANYRGDPPIMMSDLNKDNAISLEEMCYRYQSRYGGSSYGGPGGPPGYPGGPSGYPGGPPGYPGSSSSSGSPYGYRPPFGGPPMVVMGSPPPSSSSNSSSSSSSSSPSDRIKEFAERILKSNDRNNNGKLEKDEWGSVRDPESTDANRDSVITLDEMVTRMQSRMSGGDRGGDRDRGPTVFFGDRGGSGDRGGFDRGSFGDRGGFDRGSSGDRGSFSGGSAGFGDRGFSDRGGDGRGFGDRGSSSRGASSGGSGSSSSSASDPAAPKRSYRVVTPTELLPRGLDSWFTRSDADGDGQVSMSEYSSKWNPEAAQKFQQLDANGDGFISSKEALQTAPSSSRR